MLKRPFSPTYVFFYILFWPDTWRILMGIVAALLIAPRIAGTQGGLFETVMLYCMLTGIGYAASQKPARRISELLRKWITGKR